MKVLDTTTTKIMMKEREEMSVTLIHKIGKDLILLKQVTLTI